jgi:hypothetical protein
VSCSKYIFTYHFFAILGLDLFQSVLIVIAGNFIKRSVTQRSMSNLRDSIAIREMDNVANCLKQQVNIMSVFYLAFTLIDFFLIVLGNIFYEQKNFICMFDHYLIVTTNWGAFYLTLHSSFFFLFAIMIWDIFYRLPNVYGLIISKVDKKSLTLKSFAENGSRGSRLI